MNNSTQKIRYEVDASNFAKIPAKVLSYWVSNQVINLFEKYPSLNEVGITRLGMTTGENARFVRLWHEVKREKCSFNSKSQEELSKSGMYWVPYNKGGGFRKWYGNNDCVVYWKDNGYNIKNFKDENGRIRSTVPNVEYYFLPCASWSKISTGRISFRLKEYSIFDVAGACYFPEKCTLNYAMGFLNSNVVDVIISAMSPTLNYEGGQIANLPIKVEKEEVVGDIVSQNIDLTKEDWDSFETSWDFKKHPLI